MNHKLIKIFPETVSIYEVPYDKKDDSFVKKSIFRETGKSEEVANGSFISNDLYVLDKNKSLKNKLGFNFDVKITTSWATKTLPKGYSSDHSHSLSFYSGVYYPCMTDHLYNIQFFKNDRDFFILSYYVNHYDHINNECMISVKHGTLLLFNSRLSHKIPKNETNEIRYSLAFNTMPVGNVGNKLTDSHYYFK
jgi:hypothetical protein